jgi:phosphopantothenoylcysteine decarboxylase/phosphopantothenate--cysteine ligase
MYGMGALSGREIVLAVGGGIAAYKACELARLLVKAGARVQVLMTRAAREFVGPLTFQALTGRPVVTDLLDAQQEHQVGHIAIADRADLLVVAPATADLLARLRAGIADDAATAVALATRAPLLVAPAMNERMWAHAATQENVRVLVDRGARLVGPAVGEMAEPHHVGPGRLAEPAEIFAACERALRPRDLDGWRVVVSAGPTREPLDPVRFISNPSSGRMGFALAAAARDRGAHVLLVAGPTEAPPPPGVEVVRVTTAEEMQRAVEAGLDGARAVVMAAAVSDWKPAQTSAHKQKKHDGPENVELLRTPDILAALNARYDGKPGRPVLVGFAAETERVTEYAREKLKRKGLDLIVANDVGPGGAFGAPASRATLIDRTGAEEALPRLPKDEIAHLVWDRVRRLTADR